MTPEYLSMLVLGAALGGFVNGLAGFGTALFSLGIWLQVTDAVTAVAMSAAVAVITGFQGLWEVRTQIPAQWRRLARLILPALIGIPLGVKLLLLLEPRQLRLLIAGFLLLYGAFFGFRSQLPKIGGQWRPVDSLVGFLGGLLGGAASLSGALPTMWCALRGWPKLQTRAVLQPFNVAVLSVTVLTLLIGEGAYDRNTLMNLAVVIPVGIVAGRVGIQVFRHLSDDGFQRLLILSMLIMGGVLGLRELSSTIYTAVKVALLG